jgi:hypothetical protein
MAFIFVYGRYESTVADCTGQTYAAQSETIFLFISINIYYTEKCFKKSYRS